MVDSATISTHSKKSIRKVRCSVSTYLCIQTFLYIDHVISSKEFFSNLGMSRELVVGMPHQEIVILVI